MMDDVLNPACGASGRTSVRCATALMVALFCALASPPGAFGQDDGPPAAGSSLEQSCIDQLRLAFGALDAGNAEQALIHYRAALAAATGDSLRFQALLGLGSTYAALHQLDRAIPALEQARDLAPEDARVWYTLGTVYGASGRKQDALDALGQAARLQPEMVAAHYDRCVLFSELGRHADAAAACQRALAADASDVAAWTGLGVARYHMGDYGSASAAFREAVRVEPENARARYGLGLSLLYTGDKEGAVEQYVSLKALDVQMAGDLYRRIFP